MGEIPHDGRSASPGPLAPIWLAFALLVAGVIGLYAALRTAFHLTSAFPETAHALSRLLWIAGLSSAWIGLVAVIATRLAREPLGARLGLARPLRFRAVDGLIALVGALAVSQAADLLLRLGGGGRGEPVRLMLDIFRGARGPGLAAALLVVGLGTGFAEELFFRGYVQRRLVAQLGPASGVIIAAALFGFVHFNAQHALFAFLFGSFIGAVALWTGSTWPAIALHAANNATSILLVVAGFDQDEAVRDGDRLPLAAAMLALFALAVASALWIRRRARVGGVDPGDGAPLDSGA